MRFIYRDFSTQYDYENLFRFCGEIKDRHLKLQNLKILKDHKMGFIFHDFFSTIQLQWGWGITGQRITGQSCPDWLKMTSSRTSKPNSGGLSRS